MRVRTKIDYTFCLQKNTVWTEILQTKCYKADNQSFEMFKTFRRRSLIYNVIKFSKLCARNSSLESNIRYITQYPCFYHCRVKFPTVVGLYTAFIYFHWF